MAAKIKISRIIKTCPGLKRILDVRGKKKTPACKT